MWQASLQFKMQQIQAEIIQETLDHENLLQAGTNPLHCKQEMFHQRNNPLEHRFDKCHPSPRPRVQHRALVVNILKHGAVSSDPLRDQ